MCSTCVETEEGVGRRGWTKGWIVAGQQEAIELYINDIEDFESNMMLQ